MNEENEFFYDSDDDYEDIDSDDGYFNSEKYYLTDKQLDEFTLQIQHDGSKHSFYEIESFICSADEVQVYEGRHSINEPYRKVPTFNQIEQQLDKMYGKPTTKLTPLINNAKTETPKSLHENDKQKIQADDNCSKTNERKTTRVFTKELKIQFQQAAFQQWKVVVQLHQNQICSPTVFPTATTKQLSPTTKAFIPKLQFKPINNYNQTIFNNMYI